MAKEIETNTEPHFSPDIMQGSISKDTTIHWVTALNQDLYERYARKTTGTWQHSAHKYWNNLNPIWNGWRERNQAQYPSDAPLKKQWFKFSHKVEAQIETAKQLKTGYMIWLDADVEQTQPYTEEWLRQQLPKEGEMFTYLHREGYPETGWIAYNLNEMQTHTFFTELEHTYLNNKLFDLEQWHDGYVWWETYKSMSKMYPNQYKVRSLMDSVVNKGEAFGRSTLKSVFKHHKGPNNHITLSHQD